MLISCRLSLDFWFDGMLMINLRWCIVRQARHMQNGCTHCGIIIRVYGKSRPALNLRGILISLVQKRELVHTTHTVVGQPPRKRRSPVTYHGILTWVHLQQLAEWSQLFHGERNECNERKRQRDEHAQVDLQVGVVFSLSSKIWETQTRGNKVFKSQTFQLTSEKCWVHLARASTCSIFCI